MIGKRMRDVQWYADQPGGIAIIDAARLVGPHGSLQYGYRTVNRAIKAGLVIVGRSQEKGGRRGRLISSL